MKAILITLLVSCTTMAIGQHRDSLQDTEKMRRFIDTLDFIMNKAALQTNKYFQAELDQNRLPSLFRYPVTADGDTVRGILFEVSIQYFRPLPKFNDPWPKDLDTLYFLMGHPAYMVIGPLGETKKIYYDDKTKHEVDQRYYYQFIPMRMIKQD